MKKIAIIPFFILALVSCNSNSSSTSTPTPIPSTSPSSSLPSSSISINDPSSYFNKIDGVEYGETTVIEYHSNITNNTKHASVHLPASYDENTKYPVLYLLHGMLGNHLSWFESCKADIILDNCIAKLGAKPMIIVGVNSLINENETESNQMKAEFTETYDLTGKEITESLMPYINDNYSTLTDKDNTYLAGYSMGGRETLLAGFNYQSYFGYLGAFSSASFNKLILSAGTKDPVLTEFKIDEGSTGFKYILLTIGDKDFMTRGYTQQYSGMMEESNIEHEFLLLEGGHDYTVWNESLFTFILNVNNIATNI